MPGKEQIVEELGDLLLPNLVNRALAANDRAKYLTDLKLAKQLYRERIMTEMFNAYMDEPLAIRKDVMNYVNMIIGIDAEHLGGEQIELCGDHDGAPVLAPMAEPTAAWTAAAFSLSTLMRSCS